MSVFIVSVMVVVLFGLFALGVYFEDEKTAGCTYEVDVTQEVIDYASGKPFKFEFWMN